MALSLPAREERRLPQAARILRHHSAGLLLTLLLAEQGGSHPSLTVPGEAAEEGAAGLHTRVPARG
ncbi:hypothetical protein PV721_30880 [Streptomyces sp. MB09-01]|uniref:hypothetical protein n=1 Tax=Streptomyces sp. MB09-01 TaxID=3028666 RepID=UPI0029AD477E|nr:hypothetical protein [Streptomyces sp. MB09-01]MDX3538671.1 hypothetical protein [Streptomyces sp. MB09-01]